MRDVAPDIIENYNLEPFAMNVQSITRTFIDKIYALCDYYMEGKTKRYSRHLYDIYKLYPNITINDNFKKLADQVRRHRAQLPICPSAKASVDIGKLINEFLDKNFYKSDYDAITKTLIYDDVTYAQTAAVLQEIKERLF